MIHRLADLFQLIRRVHLVIPGNALQGVEQAVAEQAISDFSSQAETPVPSPADFNEIQRGHVLCELQDLVCRLID